MKMPTVVTVRTVHLYSNEPEALFVDLHNAQTETVLGPFNKDRIKSNSQYRNSELIPMDKRLIRIVNNIKDAKLRKKVYRLLERPTVKVGDRTYHGIPITDSPASIRHHHNYPGGFIEHTLALYELCTSLSRIVWRIYKCRVNSDLVICGVLLHDIFKPATYVQRDGGGYRPSNLAERIDHLTLASAELIRRGFPLDAVHVVTASHGQQYGPIGPMTIEALICHLGDYAEAKLNGDVLSAARFMVREMTGEEPQGLTGREAFAIVRAKTDRGWDGVKKRLSMQGRAS
jgi:7,8-dihydroneopterin 2',3'-cyclic phosphate phosphodiesterase